MTGTTWDPGVSRTEITGTYQAGVFLFGTLVTSAIAIVLALPLSIAIALFLSDVAGPRVARPLVYLVELLAAIPSVVYGLWGLHFFAPDGAQAGRPGAQRRLRLHSDLRRPDHRLQPVLRRAWSSRS